MHDLFREMMDKLEIPMPESGMAVTVDDALEIAEKIGYPVMVRPSNEDYESIIVGRHDRINISCFGKCSV